MTPRAVPGRPEPLARRGTTRLVGWSAAPLFAALATSDGRDGGHDRRPRTEPTAVNAIQPPERPHHAGTGRVTVLALLLGVLGIGIATASMLGPLGTEALTYRTSATTLNQIIGGDLAGLVVVAPTALAAAVLVLRRHPAGPVLALAPALWAIYMYLQLVVGQEYAVHPGNNERFFPLLLGLFVVGETIAVLGWRTIDPERLPAISTRLERAAGVVLLVLAAFLVLGLHLPTLLDAVSEQPAALEYTSSPTAFWIVKVMDLGIIVPAALTVGVGLLRHAAWARKPAYALFGSYTLLSAAVAGMAVVMFANGDPDGSIANVLAFLTFMLAVGGLTIGLLRPLLRARGPDEDVEVPGLVSAAPRRVP